MVLVQHVEIVWTKATRGMPQAEARARLPRVYAAIPGNTAYGYARLRLEEADGFRVEQRESRAAARLPATEGSLCLRAAPDGRLILGLRWNPLRGQPRRYPRPEALRLASGQWAQLQINGRHASYSGQWYTEDSYNVACGPEIDPDVFLSRPPAARFSLTAHLF